MSYTKQNFTDGQVLKAEHLNHMEDGIEKATNVEFVVCSYDDVLKCETHTYEELLTFLKSGGKCIALFHMLSNGRPYKVNVAKMVEFYDEEDNEELRYIQFYVVDSCYRFTEYGFESIE